MPLYNCCGMQGLSKRLKRLKPALKELNQKFYSNISSRVGKPREELAQVQTLCFNNRHDADLCNREKDMMSKFVELLAAEESFKKQKSRVNWLKLGDQNTKFFHQKMASNRLRNKILSLTNSAGVRLEDPSSIEAEIL